METQIEVWKFVAPGKICVIRFDRIRLQGEAVTDLVIQGCKTIAGTAFCADGVVRHVSDGLAVRVLP